jgi:hypothetical protein
MTNLRATSTNFRLTSTNVRATSQFVHRENADGTYDSFCRKCFTTIQSAKCEADLRDAETEHTCDPHVLEHFRRLLHRGGRPD